MTTAECQSGPGPKPARAEEDKMILDAMTELDLRDESAIHEMGLRHAISDNLLHADADDLRSIAAVLGLGDCLSAQALDKIEAELEEQTEDREKVLLCK